MIDPNFWRSQDVKKLTIRQRLLAIGLFSLADDDGRGIADPPYVRATVFPYDDFSSKEIEEDLKAIGERLSIVFYEVDGSRYYAWKNWNKWQTINRPQRSVLPPPPQVSDSMNDSVNGSVNESVNKSRNESMNNSEGNSESNSKNECIRKERKGRERKEPLMNDSVNDSFTDFLQKKLDNPSRLYIQQMESLLREYDEELVIKATEVALARKKNPPAPSYVRGILKSWQEKGLETVEAVRQAEGRWTEDDEVAQELATYELKTYRPEDIPRPVPKALRAKIRSDSRNCSMNDSVNDSLNDSLTRTQPDSMPDSIPHAQPNSNTVSAGELIKQILSAGDDNE
jgi:DnaD/phage-associated family protein